MGYFRSHCICYLLPITYSAARWAYLTFTYQQQLLIFYCNIIFAPTGALIHNYVCGECYNHYRSLVDISISDILSIGVAFAPTCLGAKRLSALTVVFYLEIIPHCILFHTRSWMKYKIVFETN